MIIQDYLIHFRLVGTIVCVPDFLTIIMLLPFSDLIVSAAEADNCENQEKSSGLFKIFLFISDWLELLKLLNCVPDFLTIIMLIQLS